MKIVETDNFDRDYPMEYHIKSIPEHLSEEDAEAIAKIINKHNGSSHGGQRWCKVVEDDYVLGKGLEDLI